MTQTMKNRKNIPAMVSWLDILRVSLYVIACVIVLYAIPKEGKFKYEYQKGIPWKHENLIAPFDFAEYKSQAELDKERDSVKRESKPYFTKDNQVQVSHTEKFEADFNAQLAAFGVSDSVTHAKSKVLSLFGSLKSIVYKSLSDVYNNGIVENEQILTNIDDNTRPDALVAIQNEGITTQKPKSEIITVKEAYLYVKSDIEKFLNAHQGPDAENSPLWKFTNALNPMQWIAPNLNYDQETTEKLLNEKLESISLTRGMVQKGQRIIYKGEMVGDEEFRVLESLRRDYEQHNSSGYGYVFLGQSILYMMLFALIFMFLRTFRREIFYQTKYSALILSIITFTIVMTSIVIRYNLVDIWLLPFLLLAIIIKTFFDTRTGMFLHIVTCVAVSFLMPNSFEYFTMQFIPGYILLMSYEKLNRRSQAFLTSVICFAMYTIIYVSFELMYNGLPSEINWKTIMS